MNFLLNAAFISTSYLLKFFPPKSGRFYLVFAVVMLLLANYLNKGLLDGTLVYTASYYVAKTLSLTVFGLLALAILAIPVRDFIKSLPISSSSVTLNAKYRIPQDDFDLQFRPTMKKLNHVIFIKKD